MIIKRNVYAALIALLLTVSGMAQVMVIQRMPSPTQFNPTDAWKIDLINQGGTAIKVFLRATIMQKPSALIVTLTSAEYQLQPGSNSLSPQVLQTQQEQYSSYPGIEQIRQFHELPFGEYEICIEVISVEDQSSLAQSCLDHTFMPVTPPVLVLPPSCQDPGTRFPLLTWFAPSPVLKGFTVLYDLKLAELQEGQSYEEAIQRNLAVLDIKGLRTTQLVYPSNAMPLDTSKTYVWQVSARVPLINREAGVTEYTNSIGVSEIWCIRFDKKEEEKDSAFHSYAIPKPHEPHRRAATFRMAPLRSPTKICRGPRSRAIPISSSRNPVARTSWFASPSGVMSAWIDAIAARGRHGRSNRAARAHGQFRDRSVRADGRISNSTSARVSGEVPSGMVSPILKMRPRPASTTFLGPIEHAIGGIDGDAHAMAQHVSHIIRHCPVRAGSSVRRCPCCIALQPCLHDRTSR